MIKVKDVAFVRFSAPDLSAMGKFAADFGLVTTQGTAERLYLRRKHESYGALRNATLALIGGTPIRKRKQRD